MFKKYKSRMFELWNISAPIIFEQVFINLMGMISTIMSSNVGEYAVSAIGMVDSLNFILIAVFTSLTTGGTIVIAQNIGRRDVNGAITAGAQTITLNLAISSAVFISIKLFQSWVISALFGAAEQNVIDAANVFLSIVCFSFPVLAVLQAIFGVLRGSGNTKIPMYITVIMNICNVLISYPLIFGLDFWFIHIPSFGVAGVAIGLVAARVVGLCLSVYYIVFVSYPIKLNKLDNFRIKWDIQKKVLGFGIPASIESSLFQVGKLITQVFIVTMGTASIAANSVSSSIFGFINVPGSALATAVMILVGQRVGRGELDDVKPTSMFAVKFGTILMTFLCLVFFLCNNLLADVYNIAPDTRVYYKQLLFTAFISTPILWPMSFVVPSALRATGDVKFTMVVSLASMWLFRITIGFVLGVFFKLGVVGVWFGMYIDWLVRAIFFYVRLKRDKWRVKLENKDL